MAQTQLGTSSIKVVLIDASVEQLDHIKTSLPEWNFHSISTAEMGSNIEKFISKDVDAVIVYARLQEEQHVLDLCRKIKGMVPFESLPLLVAINRFQMMLGNDIKHLPGGHYIITPIEKDVLRQRIADLRNDN